jgi:hypothetical protein
MTIVRAASMADLMLRISSLGLFGIGTRRQLVLALRNQEGGGQFDNEIRNPNYKSLRENVMMVSPRNDGVAVAHMEGLQLATMRQVAHELILSLKAHQWRTGLRKRIESSS